MQLLLRRLWIQITSDRKRFGLLCAMLAIGMLLWARIIVTTNVPRTVIADPKPPVTGPPLVNDGSDKRRGPPVPVTLARTCARNPLVISDEDFPKSTVVKMVPQENGKSEPEATEDVRQAEARLTAELLALANQFRLEGVMQGHPMAVINGETYQLGDWIQAVDNSRHIFQLVEVGNRTVLLECEGRRFKVTMDEPGSNIR
jgi:hypothetical protein